MEEIENKKFSLKFQLLSGLVWGFFMLIIMEMVIPYFDEEEITFAGILIGIPVWTVSGLGYGYFMYRYQKRKNKK